ncbi:MAG TPA: DUF4320 family protein [Peptococcaceae bacterium]|jgi:hypothetical protein|nr:DUF4320 family protein [Clostridia bacterium]HOB82619.1 DUF4320 family protein [Peptococcaceae bacterium]HPZ71074.1 DUF4320 family protein [Peptococcaceae bacterium]HQD54686.1 DUF4320 family protein [Peptococcaceae bacterium]
MVIRMRKTKSLLKHHEKYRKNGGLKKKSGIWDRLQADQRGLSETMVVVYSLFLFMIFAVLYVDLYGYFYTKNNLKQAVDETLTLMKLENGFDRQTETFFADIAQSLGIDASKVTLNGTPKTVQRGETVELTARYRYEVKGLKPFGRELQPEIEVRSEGLAHNKIR